MNKSVRSIILFVTIGLLFLIFQFGIGYAYTEWIKQGRGEGVRMQRSMTCLILRIRLEENKRKFIILLSATETDTLRLHSRESVDSLKHLLGAIREDITLRQLCCMNELDTLMDKSLPRSGTLHLH